MTTVLRALRVCDICGEFTREAECPHRLSDVPPMPATAITVPAKACGCLLGDDCGCSGYYYIKVEPAGPLGTQMAIGTAYYGGRR